jgi:hypothetical protein
VGNPEGKRPLGRPRRRWLDNIKLYLREIGWDGCNRSLFERHFCNRPLSFSIYLFAGFGRTLDSSQVCVTAITGATGNCTLEASPLLESQHNFQYPKLFIYLAAQYSNFICKHVVMWSFAIIKL